MSNIYIEDIPPGISKLIGTNAAPSDQQRNIIRDLLIKRYREVLPLSDERLLSSHQISNLHQLKTHINNLEALISPARVLIPELVATIFELCVSTQGKLPSPRPHEAPLLLGQICSSWRRIALSTPKLWRSVHLRLDPNGTPPSLWFNIMAKQALTLECWLARTGSVPIFCHIKYAIHQVWFPDAEISDYIDAIRHLISKLVPHVSQWKNIYLQVPFRCLTPLFDIHQADAPLLTSLAVTNGFLKAYHTWQFEAFSYQNLLTKFPVGARLRQIQIDIPTIFLRTLNLPWAQLEELTMTHTDGNRFFWLSSNVQLTLSDALDVLRRLPNLRRCTLALGSLLEMPLPSAPIVIPKLRKLFIHAEHIAFGFFLQVVGMPKLERLIVNKYWNPPALQSFLGRANYPIKELGFVRVHNLSDDDLFNCLELVPSLTHLQCTSPVGGLVLRALTPSTIIDSSPSCLCPQLEFIELSCRRPFDPLVEMIEGRCGRSNGANGVSQLKRARLHLRNTPLISEIAMITEAGLMKRLQQCADEGLDIMWHL